MAEPQIKTPAGPLDPLSLWAGLVLRLALVLCALGFLPVVAVTTMFTGMDPLIPVLLLYTVGPLGVVAALLAAILYLARVVRRARRGSS